jgi:maltose alpha-D-glucosyltransferase/alpha-amylase
MINDLWYKNAVIYCLSVGSYMDANGDGVGDFAGLMRRLDYLHGLGVTAIWLMPFQASPGRDDGYDISDYYQVDARYGTLGDFVEFTHAAKQRGIRVIIDLVVNHTSDQHAWFQEARRNPESTRRDWYVWSKKKPRDSNKGMVFPGVQKSTWSYDSVARAWYFHRFYDFQPDLNTSNPHVLAEILKIMGFWIQLGVSGFRMDAVPFVIATKGPQVHKPVEQYEMLRLMREFLQWRQGLFRSCRGSNAHDVQFPGESESLLFARRKRCSTAATGAQGHQVPSQDGPVGYVLAKSRRARSRTPHQGAA